MVVLHICYNYFVNKYRHSILKSFQASGSHTFRGIFRKALFRKPLKCLAMLKQAAGFISFIISSALLLRNWFIACPENTEYFQHFCCFFCSSYSPIIFPWLITSLTLNLVFCSLKSTSILSILMKRMLFLFLNSFPYIFATPSTSTEKKCDFLLNVFFRVKTQEIAYGKWPKSLP